MTESGYAPAPPPPAPPVHTAQPNGPSGPRASFGRRLVAIIVDWVILAIAYGILAAIFGYEESGSGPANLLSILVGVGYFTAFEGSARGQTPGKMALGIRVVGFDTGTSIGYGRAFLRYIGRILSTIPCFLGYFWMLWDGEKQTWHDKIASDVVVPVSAYPLPS